MKGRITLQPLRKENYNQVGWPVFDTENAWFGRIEYEEEHGVKIQDTDETIFLFDNVKEFMVQLEDGSILELNHDSVEEAMDHISKYVRSNYIVKPRKRLWWLFEKV